MMEARACAHHVHFLCPELAVDDGLLCTVCESYAVAGELLKVLTASTASDYCMTARAEMWLRTVIAGVMRCQVKSFPGGGKALLGLGKSCGDNMILPLSCL